jgi:anaerobic selenocysteine-containing dehydrogenase
VNPIQETGLTRYWVPSIASSAIFGTRVLDDFFPVAIGGDVAFLNGALKHLMATDALDHAFLTAHTSRGNSSKRVAASAARTWGASRASSPRLAPPSSSTPWA